MAIIIPACAITIRILTKFTQITDQQTLETSLPTSERRTLSLSTSIEAQQGPDHCPRSDHVSIPDSKNISTAPTTFQVVSSSMTGLQIQCLASDGPEESSLRKAVLDASSVPKNKTEKGFQRGEEKQASNTISRRYTGIWPWKHWSMHSFHSKRNVDWRMGPDGPV